MVFRTLLSILADQINVLVRTVSIFSRISSFLSPNYLELSRTLQLWLVWLSTLYSETFSTPWKDPDIYPVFRFLLLLQSCNLLKLTSLQVNMFSVYKVKLNLVFFSGSCESFFIWKSKRFSMSHFPGPILVCAYTIRLYDQSMENSNFASFPVD